MKCISAAGKHRNEPCRPTFCELGYLKSEGVLLSLKQHKAEALQDPNGCDQSHTYV